MTTTELRGQKQIDDAAIEYVIERERAEAYATFDAFDPSGEPGGERP